MSSLTASRVTTLPEITLGELWEHISFTDEEGTGFLPRTQDEMSRWVKENFKNTDVVFTLPFLRDKGFLSRTKNGIWDLAPALYPLSSEDRVTLFENWQDNQTVPLDTLLKKFSEKGEKKLEKKLSGSLDTPLSPPVVSFIEPNKEVAASPVSKPKTKTSNTTGTRNPDMPRTSTVRTSAPSAERVLAQSANLVSVKRPSDNEDEEVVARRRRCMWTGCTSSVLYFEEDDSRLAEWDKADISIQGHEIKGHVCPVHAKKIQGVLISLGLVLPEEDEPFDPTSPIETPEVLPLEGGYLNPEWVNQGLRISMGAWARNVHPQRVRPEIWSAKQVREFFEDYVFPQPGLLRFKGFLKSVPELRWILNELGLKDPRA